MVLMACLSETQNAQSQNVENTGHEVTEDTKKSSLGFVIFVASWRVFNGSTQGRRAS